MLNPATDIPNRYKDGPSYRAYKTDTAYRGSHDLLPGEKKRDPSPWPGDDAKQCTKCGSTGRFAINVKTGVAHCTACGEWFWREGPAPWRPADDKLTGKVYRRREITVVCTNPKCQKSFTTNNHNGLVKWCPECREARRQDMEYQRERRRKYTKKATNGHPRPLTEGKEVSTFA